MGWSEDRTKYYYTMSDNDNTLTNSKENVPACIVVCKQKAYEIISPSGSKKTLGGWETIFHSKTDWKVISARVQSVRYYAASTAKVSLAIDIPEISGLIPPPGLSYTTTNPQLSAKNYKVNLVDEFNNGTSSATVETFEIRPEMQIEIYLGYISGFNSIENFYSNQGGRYKVNTKYFTKVFNGIIDEVNVKLGRGENPMDGISCTIVARDHMRYLIDNKFFGSLTVPGQNFSSQQGVNRNEIIKALVNQGSGAAVTTAEDPFLHPSGRPPMVISGYYENEATAGSKPEQTSVLKAAGVPFPIADQFPVDAIRWFSQIETLPRELFCEVETGKIAWTVRMLGEPYKTSSDGALFSGLQAYQDALIRGEKPDPNKIQVKNIDILRGSDNPWKYSYKVSLNTTYNKKPYKIMSNVISGHSSWSTFGLITQFMLLNPASISGVASVGARHSHSLFLTQGDVVTPSSAQLSNDIMYKKTLSGDKTLPAQDPSLYNSQDAASSTRQDTQIRNSTVVGPLRFMSKINYPVRTRYVWDETSDSTLTAEEADKILSQMMSIYSRDIEAADLVVPMNPDIRPGHAIDLYNTGYFNGQRFRVESVIHMFASGGVQNGCTTALAAVSTQGSLDPRDVVKFLADQVSLTLGTTEVKGFKDILNSHDAEVFCRPLDFTALYSLVNAFRIDNFLNIIFPVISITTRDPLEGGISQEYNIPPMPRNVYDAIKHFSDKHFYSVFPDFLVNYITRDLTQDGDGDDRLKRQAREEFKAHFLELFLRRLTKYSFSYLASYGVLDTKEVPLSTAIGTTSVGVADINVYQILPQQSPAWGIDYGINHKQDYDDFSEFLKDTVSLIETCHTEYSASSTTSFNGDYHSNYNHFYNLFRVDKTLPGDPISNFIRLLHRYPNSTTNQGPVPNFAVFIEENAEKIKFRYELNLCPQAVFVHPQMYHIDNPGRLFNEIQTSTTTNGERVPATNLYINDTQMFVDTAMVRLIEKINYINTFIDMLPSGSTNIYPINDRGQVQINQTVYRSYLPVSDVERFITRNVSDGVQSGLVLNHYYTLNYNYETGLAGVNSSIAGSLNFYVQDPNGEVTFKGFNLKWVYAESGGSSPIFPAFYTLESVVSEIRSYNYFSETLFKKRLEISYYVYMYYSIANYAAKNLIMVESNRTIEYLLQIQVGVEAQTARIPNNYPYRQPLVNILALLKRIEQELEKLGYSIN